MTATAKKTPGYKQTDVGVIPEDWQLFQLGQLVHSVEYGSSAKSEEAGAVPVLRMGNLQAGKIDWSDLVYTNDESEIRRYLLNDGDVLFNRTNTIELVGKSARYEGERPAIFAGYLIRVHANKSILDTRYLNYMLNTEMSRKHSLKVLSVAVGQANINGQKLKTYPIPLPPTLQEQEAIAEALSDADAYIESLERLVAKKRRVKQGAMQELLTGKRRLPGFEHNPSYKQTRAGVIPEDWGAASLLQLASALPNAIVGGPFGSELTSRDYCAVGVPVIRGQNMSSQSVSGEFVFVSQDKARSLLANIAKPGDLIFTQRGTLGQVSIVPAGFHPEYLVSQSQMKITLDDRCAQAKFVFYYFISDDGQRQILDSAIQTGVPHTNLGILKSYFIPLPPKIAEQEAIAAILSDMDAEIDALETKLAKARDVKRGMMRELLTGRVRLV